MHHSTALFFLVLVVTGVILYIGPLEAAVGDRGLIAAVHIYAGIAVLVPVFSSIVHSPKRSQTRRYLHELSRWTTADRVWVAQLPRLDGPRSSRFNAGQKLNANLNFAGLLLMLVTGLMMASYLPVSIATRQGATFIHDVLALVLLVAFVGHLVMALTHSRSLVAMFGKKAAKG